MLNISKGKKARPWLPGWGCPGVGFVARCCFRLPGQLAGRLPLLHRMFSAPVRALAVRSLAWGSCILAGGKFG